MNERGGRGGAGGGRGGKPPRGGAPPRGGSRGGPKGPGAPRSSGPRREGGSFGGPPRSGGPRREGGSFGGPPRSGGPRREGGSFGGPPRSGGFKSGGDRGPRREGGGFGGGDRGPRREGGSFGGPPRSGGFKSGGDRGPHREGGGFGGPRREGGFKGGGFGGGDRGPRREGGFKGGGFGGGDRGPRREGGFKGGGFGGGDRGPRREGGTRSTGSGQGFGGDRGAKSPSWGAGARPRAATGGFGAPRRAEGGRGRAFAKAPAPAVTRPGEPIRLQALLARAGVASRREAETMIAEGRVQVNGEVVTTLGTKAIPGKDHVKVDGKLIGGEERKVYFLFHKPGGVITAASDPHGRPVVIDYLKVRERIFPVGRLDWDTEGLLVLTNDGDLAYRLTHPSFQVPRTYHAKVKGIPDEKVLTRLRRGVRLDDGKAFVEKVRVVGTTGKNTWLEVIVTEGRNRLVRRILEAVGHPVQKLKRTAYGGLVLGNLKPGQSRVLSKEEVDKLLRRVADTEPQAPARGRAPSERYDEGEAPARGRVRRVASDSEEEGLEWVSSKDAGSDEEE